MPPRGTERTLGWTCPTCGRRFRRRTREHSCTVRSVAAHLEHASPAVRDTFDALQQALAAVGPHVIVPVKTMMVIRAGANFGNVVVRRDAINLEFALSRALRHTRVRKSDRLGPRRFTHHVRLTSPAAVDDELLEWLRESYVTTTNRRGARRRPGGEDRR